VLVTDGAEGASFLRGDAVEVLSPSAARVEAPCPYAGPSRCGGCDFQHVAPPAQRDLKAQVVREQLHRLAGIDREVVVEGVAGDQDGLGWRTRVRWSATPDGRPGLLAHRSSDVIPVDRCLIAHPDLPSAEAVLAAGVESASSVLSSTGEQVVLPHPGPTSTVTEFAAGRRWQVGAGEFWQVHPGAAETLASVVRDGAEAAPGERCWDLYAGVGLFSGVLAEAVGPEGAVVAVESHRRALAHLRDNLADQPQVRAIADRVDRFVRSRQAQGHLEVVVLDPPRAGAGKDVVRRITARAPRVVVYVACDPAALSRDLATFATEAYSLDSLRAFDLFPMTHHIECVAVLRATREIV
jgi:tRNA/tmRNA/rRNA uracil-C5-methylase (TrmA/RlmC/RlmD family)